MARMQTAEGDLQTKRSDAGQISGRRLLVGSSLLAEPPAGMASALAVDKLESGPTAFGQIRTSCVAAHQLPSRLSYISAPSTSRAPAWPESPCGRPQGMLAMKVVIAPTGHNALVRL